MISGTPKAKATLCSNKHEVLSCCMYMLEGSLPDIRFPSPVFLFLEISPPTEVRFSRLHTRYLQHGMSIAVQVVLRTVGKIVTLCMHILA